ncbi:precorrin methylase [Sphingomonas sp. ABOLD]|uniref:Cobalt-precorrin 5A hydrolase n=1 Tax=Sphingomonas trueperi TaxID=53317 RepID=A0A7X5Y229_9SPHN|nr:MULTISPECIES: cobalamin biosynthesis protein [Sphingomonas]NJB99656.1 cobalt-precorrin 5A hydrolase [Sphingomonas trueperi]RSV37412.1 precorrin methylase [Sphingomonas sp. ABOLE]RSV50627.1 precorrin methylase [Sphingomonas sp. ABOLD]
MIVAGFGYRSGATAASLRSALALAQTGAPPVTHVATLADKLPLLAALGLPTIVVDAVAGVATPTRSPASLAARGTGSVAEAAALAAAGPGARLLVTRQISPDRMATCAIAEGAPV